MSETAAERDPHNPLAELWSARQLAEHLVCSLNGAYKFLQRHPELPVARAGRCARGKGRRYNAQMLREASAATPGCGRWGKEGQERWDHFLRDWGLEAPQA